MAGVSKHAQRFTLPQKRRGHRPGYIPDRPTIPRGQPTLPMLPCLTEPLATISPLGDRRDVVIARVRGFLADLQNGPTSPRIHVDQTRELTALLVRYGEQP